jgi:aminopeptidase N
LQLQVIVPAKKWVVFGNGALVQKLVGADAVKFIEERSFTLLPEEDANLFACHIFEQSPPISSYLYGMDAGNYSIIDNDNKKFKVPLRIGIRKSKIKYCDPREYFRLMEAAIVFYEEFFSTPFAWSKYDTVFCPEFRINGMENVGLINLTDKFFKPKTELTEF